MSIQVISNSEPVAVENTAVDPKKENTSAPEAKAAGQNESTESDTEESESSERDGEESEDEDDGDTEASDKSDDSEKDNPKKKSGSQRRKERAERAEAEVIRLRKVVEDMALKSAGESKPNSKPAEAMMSDEGEPQPDDFETHREFLKAVVKWDREQADKAAKDEENKTRLQKEHESVLKTHFDREKAFSEKTKDYAEVIKDLLEDNPRISAAFEAEILESENGPAIMYELAKKPGEFERINKLNPRAITREIAKIEFNLSASKEKPEPKKITNAPKPLDPVGKGSSGSNKKSITDPSLSQSEYEKIRRQQMREAQG